jgi:glycine dehydrogenase
MIKENMFDSCFRSRNKSSAAMAGMKIIVTKTMENGNIDVEDVREKLQYKDQLSCLMITFTHGVF